MKKVEMNHKYTNYNLYVSKIEDYKSQIEISDNSGNLNWSLPNSTLENLFSEITSHSLYFKKYYDRQCNSENKDKKLQAELLDLHKRFQQLSKNLLQHLSEDNKIALLEKSAKQIENRRSAIIKKANKLLKNLPNQYVKIESLSDKTEIREFLSSSITKLRRLLYKIDDDYTLQSEVKIRVKIIKRIKEFERKASSINKPKGKVGRPADPKVEVIEMLSEEKFSNEFLERKKRFVKALREEYDKKITKAKLIKIIAYLSHHQYIGKVSAKKPRVYSNVQAQGAFERLIRCFDDDGQSDSNFNKQFPVETNELEKGISTPDWEMLNKEIKKIDNDTYI